VAWSDHFWDNSLSRDGYVLVEQSRIVVYPGEERVVDLLNRPMRRHWRSELEQFCDRLGIPWQEPDWHIEVMKSRPN
jgi:tRNA(Ile)-lysidine synthase TilS/MesJ